MYSGSNLVTLLRAVALSTPQLILLSLLATLVGKPSLRLTCRLLRMWECKDHIVILMGVGLIRSTAL